MNALKSINTQIPPIIFWAIPQLVAVALMFFEASRYPCFKGCWGGSPVSPHERGSGGDASADPCPLPVSPRPAMGSKKWILLKVILLRNNYQPSVLGQEE